MEKPLRTKLILEELDFELLMKDASVPGYPGYWSFQSLATALENQGYNNELTREAETYLVKFGFSHYADHPNFSTKGKT
jgi:hypothetical protein